MTTNEAVIIGVGMTTAVGLSAAETAASVGSGVMRFGTTDLRDRLFEPFTIAEVPDDGLPEVAEQLEKDVTLTSRERRMLRLATRPLRDCLEPLGERRQPIGICLALPETETRLPLDRQRFLHRLMIQSGGAFHPEGSDASHTGRAGGVLAVGQAVAAIYAGIVDFIIAGGIDTYRDLYVLGTLDLERRVKSSGNHDGFIPGEGAAFVLLASARAAAARGIAALGRVSPVAVGFEAGHLYSEEPYLGEGLAAVLTQVADIETLPIDEIYSSMNGESHWAKEWGVGYIRNRLAFSSGYRMHHPADSLGDTGAACGPLMLGLAALGLKRRPGSALVYASSDRGSRAAIVVSAN